MLLFSALLPPSRVVESLRTHLDPLREEVPEPRWAPPAQWHITLGFYGEDDPEARVEWLGKALAGRSAPTLRLQGAGTFSRVLYLGVYSEGLTELAAAAGAEEERPYLPHLTVARTAGDVPHGAAAAAVGVRERAVDGRRSGADAQRPHRRGHAVLRGGPVPARGPAGRCGTCLIP